MLNIPAALAAHLAEPATTLCRCWKLVRRDGAVLGFTDHDRDLTFGGTTFAAATGLDAAEATAELGLAVGGGEVAGALSSAGLTEADIAAGLYDDATVETWLVNWSEPAERLLLDVASIGEIRQADGAFLAELRGPAHRLDQERGLLYRASCSADLGDARCRLNLDQPAHTATASVAATDGALTLRADGLGAYPPDVFTAGKLLWTGGPNAGRSVEVKTHRSGLGGTGLDLWQRMPATITPGDTFRVSAGCDKAFCTCRDRFANTLNFRGFPHMPGNDFVLRVAKAGAEVFDGGSLFR